MSAQRYREALSLLAVPVCVVTTRQADQNWGLTASTVTGVSLDPPLVSVSIARSAGCHESLTQAPEFVVNVLGADQFPLALRFATRGIDRFADGGLTVLPGTDLPVVADANATYRCTRHAVIPVGDHDLLIGELTDVQLRADARPLTWFRRDFHRPERHAADRWRLLSAAPPEKKERPA